MPSQELGLQLMNFSSSCQDDSECELSCIWSTFNDNEVKIGDCLVNGEN